MARGGRAGSEPGSAVAASGDPADRTDSADRAASVEPHAAAPSTASADATTTPPADLDTTPGTSPDTSPIDAAADTAAALPPGVTIEAPEPPRRVRRPLDRIRLVAAVLGLGAALLVGTVTVNTVAGLEADVEAATAALPRPVVLLVATVSGLLLLALPVAIVIDLLVGRRLRVLVDGLLAFAAAVAVTSGLRWLLLNVDSLATLAVSLTGSRVTSPGVDALTAGVIALATVAQIGQQPRWRGAAMVLLALYGLSLITLGPTVLAVVVSMLLGRVVGLLARYAAGTTPSRPGPRAVLAALARAGVPLVSLRPRAQASGDPSLFDATHADGRPVVVHVLDRDHEGAGVVPALWRTLRFREGAGRRRALVSLRRAVEHEALVSLAMAGTGARVQRLLAAVPAEPGGAVLAFEDVPGRTLEEVDLARLDDATLDAVWGQVALLHRRAVAHRALSAHNVVLTPDGGAGLRITPAGLVAASETVVRLDVVQLLVTCALRVGPERAVASAGRVLGADRLAAAAPLLQPVALLRSTRRRVRAHLLDDLRSRIVEAAPSAEVTPATLERLRPRTVVSAVALTIAAYVLVGQVAGLDLVGVVRGADWRWLAVGALLNVFRYAGAALGLLGFVTERLRFLRSLWVQVAASFLGLVAPAGVGGAAVNVRYLQRAGVPAAAAVATVTVWQLGTTVATVVLVVVVAVLAGNVGEAESISVPSPALAGVAVVLGLAVLVMAVPPSRRFVLARLRPYLHQVVPRLGTVFSRPWRLVTGVAGTLVQAIATVLVMGACILAFGGSVNWALVTVVVLAGTAVGSAAPTPGGLGAVEAVLSAGLTAGGLDGATAVSAVLLFRLLTFWLPVLPGWVAFTLLQRADRI